MNSSGIHKKMKHIFLDIDGTILNERGVVPESARKAISLAKQKGHKVYLNTGRSVAEVPKCVEELDFSGMVGAAGAYVSIDNRVIFNKHIDKETLFRAYDFLIANKIPFMVETNDLIHGTKLGVEVQKRLFQELLNENPEREISLGGLFDLMREEENIYDITAVNKLLIYESPVPFEELKKGLGESLVITISSLNLENSISGEVNEINITKASGMEEIVKQLVIDKADTIAFGDGFNDFEMLAYAGVGVAMGNSDDELKKIADMVTDAVGNDGLYKGFEQCGLFE